MSNLLLELFQYVGRFKIVDVENFVHLNMWDYA